MTEFRLNDSLEPRTWQKEALLMWSRDYVGVVRVVTGGGKTFFALFCIDEYLQRNNGSRVIIIVPTVALMDQWLIELLEQTSLQDEDISLHGGGHKDKKFGKICLMIINTARTLAMEARSGQNTMLVVDECHRAATDENSKSIDIAPNATLGLSATPEREYDSGFEEIISPILGEVIYNYDYIRAKNDGVISDFELNNVKISLSEKENSEYEELSRSIAKSTGIDDDKIPQSVMKRASLVACAGRRVPGVIAIVNMHLNDKIIIFHERINEMLKIHSNLRAQGINAVAYHSRQGPHIRRNNLAMFRKGISNVLVTCKALDEGLNVPDASVGIVAASTASERQRIQRLGRILRPSKDKDTSTIYTIYATEAEEKRLAIESIKLDGVSEVNWMWGE